MAKVCKIDVSGNSYCQSGLIGDIKYECLRKFCPCQGRFIINNVNNSRFYIGTESIYDDYICINEENQF